MKSAVVSCWSPQVRALCFRLLLIWRILTFGTVGLIVPSAFSTALVGTAAGEASDLGREVLRLSRAAAVILLFAYGVYVFFQMRSHHGLYDDILEMDERKDDDRHKDLNKDKLTLTECIFAIILALACVSLIAYILVQQIHWIVEERGIHDA